MKNHLGLLQNPKKSLILMANKGFIKLLFYFFFFFIACLTVCSSGTLVGFSFDARRNSKSLSAATTISFLKKNKVSSSQIRVFVADHRNLNTLSNTRILVDVYLNPTEAENLGRSKASAISWIKTHLLTFHPYTNFTSIIIGTSNNYSVAQKHLPLLIPTLNSIHSALKTLKLDHQVKISVAFSLSVLDKLHKQYQRDLVRVLNFLQENRSFIMVETDMIGELSMGDQFIGLVIKSATSAATVIHGLEVPMVLNIKSYVVPSATEVTEFTKKMMESLESSSLIDEKISGLFTEISPIKESEQKELNREEEQIFHASHRELLYNSKKPISRTKITQHDTISLTPITIPTMNPTPTIVTVPSTNPVTVMPTNPAAMPVTVPTTNPVVTTPITVPSTNPTNPLVPGFTTPVPVPVTPPMTNPVTPYPFPPPANNPVTNPVTTPVTNNPPTASGQAWCVAKTGAMASALQVALDYACGANAVDCSAIQSTGNCYNPNTLQNHASYAFNSYYQKNPVPTSCDFGGAAMLVNINPSTGSCVYPSSSSSSATPTPSSSTTTPTPLPTTTPTPISIPTANPTTPPITNPITAPITNPTTTPTPTAAGASSGTPPAVLNTSYPNSPTDIYGSQPPPGISSTTSIAACLQSLFVSIILATSITSAILMMDV